MPSFFGEFTFTSAALLASVVCMIPVVGSADASADDERAIRVVITNYEGALNARSAEQAVALYTDDAVMMPPYNQSVVGKAQVRKAYEAGTKMRALNLKFTVDEVVQMSPEWAFVRTKSQAAARSFRQAPRMLKRISNFSYCIRVTTELGRLHAIVFPTQIRRRAREPDRKQ